MKTISSKIIALLLVVSVLFHIGETVELEDFKVNSDITSLPQTNPRIAVSGDRSFVITWVDRRSGNAEIYIQKYSVNGSQVGSNRKINDDLNNAYQSDPAIGIDLFGRYSLTWLDYRDGAYPTSPNIYFQGFDSLVSEAGSNQNFTDVSITSIKESPDISISQQGDGVVVWADNRDGNWDVFGQLFTFDGTLIGVNFLINDDTVRAQQHAPKVSMAPEGWFVVTWYDNRNDSTGDDIFIQRFDKFANKIDVNTKVTEDETLTRQAFPDVSADGSGHFTVVWVDWRLGNYPDNPEIFSRRYDTSLVPLTDEILINNDSTNSAQREAVISADRMGNVAIIWADSTENSWDIIGQMIDVDGNVRDTNFQANSYKDSSQFDPDVALDGTYRYVTWSDKRNGNFDIYASVTKYNDPTIIATPQTIIFEMPIGGPLPLPIELEVDHGGFNNLGFVITGGDDWLTVLPREGTTPDTILLSVNTTSIDYGTYQTALTIVDTINNDSSAIVIVELKIVSPELSVTPDSLYFKAFYGMNNSQSQLISILNLGTGSLNWNANSLDPWLNLSETSGIAPSNIEISTDIIGLDTGLHISEIVFEAGGIIGKDTISVVLEVFPNHPVIAVTPDSIYAEVFNRNLPDLNLIISNEGTGNLNWVAESNKDWLSLSRLSGGDGDQIILTLDSLSIPTGLNIAEIKILDTASINDSVLIPVVINWIEQSQLKVTPNYFDLFSFLQPLQDTFTIVTNSGVGFLNWEAQASVPWLMVTSNGMANDTLFISTTDPNLALGEYTATIEITDATAVNSPIVIPFIFNLHDKPEIFTIDQAIEIITSEPSLVDTFVVIENRGGANLMWQASTQNSWMNVSPSNGVDNDTLYIRLNNNDLNIGEYNGVISITDNSAINSPYFVNVSLTILDIPILPNSIDTVIIESVQIQPFEPTKIRISLNLTNEYTELSLPLEYDEEVIQIDSLLFSDDIIAVPSDLSYNTSESDRLIIQLTTNEQNNYFNPGIYFLCDIWVTANIFEGLSVFNAIVENQLSPYLITPLNDTVDLEVISGEVTSNIPTAVEDDLLTNLPYEFSLKQNYPNPFNSETIISFELSQSGDLTLEIFNVLGQNIRQFQQFGISPGTHVINWDGRYQSGRQAPSGIYFYRLQSNGYQAVKKMIFLK